ncbi:lipase [Luteitalea sp. TBR-22]|uniref:alpha/beta hydrolase family protein n=1 Tax=Luteitalea sp. TBR-22 TaxID=2802971 RepID=UPI001AF926BF|nr:prolyl oligopeptidase family serine peptidase [Luteitalea sp. TBR-22]BCS31772.1 lipase [Luteitalea sp. TBR-22]
MRVALVALLAWMAGVAAAGAQDGAAWRRQENVVFGLASGVGLVMDVFTPTGTPNGLGIIDVLSGAWYSEEAQVRDHLRAKIFDIHCARGYTVFMVRPGSRTAFTADAMAAHVGRAVAYIRAHATEYRVDPDRLGMTGASAGAHLALLALATQPDLGIRAAALFFPPTDFLEFGTGAPPLDRLGGLLFAGGVAGRTAEEVTRKAGEISPARRVTRALPPVLLIHGDADATVPLQQSEKMVRVLKDAGGEARLIVKPGGGHPWPTLPEEVAVMADWFGERLRQ